ncbi:MAG: helix-turn-helix domain-containing protein [Acetatifactor sp.]|nr:helix-turn-helix domain-containing protein [Acetatifactor sp.]
MGIVERIKEKAAEKGTNMTAIENECGLGHGAIRRWNSNSPSIDKVEIIANFLSVSIEYLITGKEPGNLTPEEQQLVDLYRQADDRGKRSILRLAQDEARELESSTSGPGSTGTDN